MARNPGDRNYTIEEKAQAVAIYHTEAKGSAKAAERLTGVSHNTILSAARDPQISAMSGVTKEQLASGFRNLTAKLIKRYEGLVDEADLSNRGTTLLGIVADKALLYADQPNQIVQQQTDAGPYLKQLISRGFGEDEAKMILEEAERRRKEYGS